MDLSASGAYGTGSISPANIYPLDGDRFVPGIPPPGFPATHVGGDNWSADAAIRYITNQQNWHGMMVSLGGIDKLGHMWGPEDPGASAEPPGSAGTAAEREMRHLPFIAKNADVQVGRIVDALEAKGVLDETLIVITADHAAQTGRHFNGVLAEGVTNPLCSNTPYPHRPTDPASTGIRSDCNWYLGRDADEIYLDPSPAVAALRDRLGGNLAFSYQDTQVAAWLNDRSLAKKREAAAAVLDMPDVMASYYINAAQDDYRLYDTNHISGQERSYFARHAEELVDTMANSSAPDVVGLVRTNATYGVMGDHGGSTKLVQNIPMVFYGPGVGAKDSNKEMRARRRDADDPRDDGYLLRRGQCGRRSGEALEIARDLLDLLHPDSEGKHEGTHDPVERGATGSARSLGTDGAGEARPRLQDQPAARCSPQSSRARRLRRS